MLVLEQFIKPIQKDVTDPEGTGPSGIRRMLRVLQNTIRNQALRKFKALQLVE